MKQVKITPVVENSAQLSMGVIAEHGLSILIEQEDETILFDTGQGMALSNNLKHFGKDITKIDKLVLSHGHYDHTGGLEEVSKKSSEVEIFAHEAAFLPKYASFDQGENVLDIGNPVSREQLINNKAILNFSNTSINVSNNIITTGEVEFSTEFEKIEPHFYADDSKGNRIKDLMPDDLGIVIDTPSGIVLILGCTHRGIINTLEHVSKLTGSKKFHTIMGGLHLGGADEEKMDLIIKRLMDFQIDNLVTGHCTGRSAQIRLAASPKLNHSFIGLGTPYIF